MKILILGGTGMLGPWAVKALKPKEKIKLENMGFEVIPLDG